MLLPFPPEVLKDPDDARRMCEALGMLDPTERALTGVEAALVRRRVGALPIDERQVIRCRYGLANFQPHTVRACALRFGLSPHTVARVEQRALLRLRAALDAEGSLWPEGTD